jgi:hypothetical protein
VGIVVRDEAAKTIYQADSSLAIPVSASAPLPRLNVTVMVQRDQSQFISTPRRLAGVGFVLALLLAFVAAFLLDRHLRSRSRGIARVANGIAASCCNPVTMRASSPTTSIR